MPSTSYPYNVLIGFPSCNKIPFESSSIGLSPFKSSISFLLKERLKPPFNSNARVIILLYDTENSAPILRTFPAFCQGSSVNPKVLETGNCIKISEVSLI